MRLSDAIEMGRVLVRPYAGMILMNDTGVERGCALGMAGRAAGVYKEGQTVNGTVMGDLWREWPWTMEQRFEMPFADVCVCAHMRCVPDDYPLRMATAVIGHAFDEHVCEDEMTLDDLIAWVRSVEPPEAVAGALEPGTGSSVAGVEGVEILAVLR